MSRKVPVFLLLLVVAMLSPVARPAERALTMGSYISYIGGFEGDWALELYLESDYRATYTLSTRSAGESPSSAKREVLRGRWEVRGDSLRVSFRDLDVDSVIEYKIRECLRYVSNTSVYCTFGLDPVETAEPHRLSHQLWHVVSLTGPPK